MPKTSNQTKHHGPNNRTRNGAKKPKVPKSWYGRVAMRQLAKAMDRLQETMTAFEIREDIREEKRNRRNRPHLMAIKEQRQAEAAYSESRRRRIKAIKRDASGRFVAKRGNLKR